MVDNLQFNFSAAEAEELDGGYPTKTTIELPMANIVRMMRKILPTHAKITKEAKKMMQECASEFISFVTGEAAAICVKDNRKTVTGDDVCFALSSLGLEIYGKALDRYLELKFEKDRSAAAASASANQEDLPVYSGSCYVCALDMLCAAGK